MRRIIPILLILSTLSFAQQYLWPTDASKLMTSSFCEFRPRHYHAAIDIKTWGQSGYKIFAIDDGYVERLRIAANGYGKAIYLRLDDGNIAIYAHLQGFNDALTRYADSLRVADRRLIMDTYPGSKRFRVKKGDFLGLTGETGIGVPHLHFEIRDRHQNPINPLQFYEADVKDNIAPKSRFLAVVPLQASTLINFKPDTLIVPVPQTKSAEVAQPIHISGSAYLALRSYDLGDGMHNRFDIYRANMFINDSLVYSLRYDRFSYSETHLLELDKNFSLWRKGLRVYHNFYRDPANSLPFYGEHEPSAGELSARSLKPGRNSIRIEVFDFHENGSSLDIPVIYHPPQQATVVDVVKSTDDVLRIALKSTQPIKSVQLAEVTRNLTSRWDLGAVALGTGQKIDDDYHYYFEAPALMRKQWLEIVPQHERAYPFLPIYVPTVLEGQLDHAPVVSGSQSYSGTIALISQYATLSAANSALFSFEFQPGRFVNAFTLGADGELPELSLSKPAAHEALDRFSTVIPGKATTIRSDDGVVSVQFPTNAAYDTLHVSTRRYAPSKPLALPYRYLSDIYEVKPFDQPLNFGANFSMHLADSIAQQKGVGIYYLDRRRGWLFLPTKTDSRTGRRYTKVTSLEKFVVIQDSLPPEITALTLSLKGRKNRNGILLRVRDSFSGLYKETQISVKIDGRWTLFEFDPEEDTVLIPSRFVPEGTHQLVITATDNAGNKASKRFTIQK